MLARYKDFKPQTKRFIRWLGLVLFFLMAPALVLLFLREILENAFRTDENGNLIQEIRDDLPLILLSFYPGTVGAICLYVYERTQLEQTSPPLVTQTAMLLFGGLTGAAVFFLIRSEIAIHLLYPKIDLERLGSDTPSYRSTVILAFLAGVIGPKLVARAQQAAGVRLSGRQ